MLHRCAACACELEELEEVENKPIATSPPVLPTGWFLRCIDEVDYVLCDVCGNQSHFRGGISPYLMEALDLFDGAQCDVSAEVSVLSKARRRIRRRKQAI